MDSASSGEVMVVPFFGQGHLNPFMELCKRIASLNYKAIFIVSSHLSSSVPSSFRQHPFIEVIEIPNSSTPPETDDEGSGSGSEEKQGEPGQNRHEDGPRFRRPMQRRNQHLIHGIESFLSERYPNPDQTRPRCIAVVDTMMSWSNECFVKMGIPVATFFTSGACNSAIEYAKSKHNADDLKPGETRVFPGLPKEMGFSYADKQKQESRMRPGMGRGRGRGRPDGPGSGREHPGPGEMSPDGPGSGRVHPGPGERRPGPPQRKPWWEQTEGSKALLFNACDDLEGPFIKYLSDQLGRPVWGVGPMLPEQYWQPSGTVIHDRDVRSNQKSSVTEDEVMEWLDSKPKQSVLYIAFGTEVGPSMEEFAELAKALEELNRPFIWVIPPGSGIQGPARSFLGGNPYELQEGYSPDGLEQKVGERGLIIKGWAPQLLILSHPSVGGFLSHCGWNSTVEAIGRGVPILAWPIRGDQIYNAKLVADHLKIGYSLMNKDDPVAMMTKDEIKSGVDKLMDDEVLHKKAMEIGHKFQQGFPASSAASLKALVESLAQ